MHCVVVVDRLDGCGTIDGDAESIVEKLSGTHIDDEMENFQKTTDGEVLNDTNNREPSGDVSEIRSPRSTTDADCGACDRPDETVLTMAIQAEETETETESKVVLETNIYRLSDNVINLNDDMKKLTKAEDERGLSTWTDNNKRWGIIENDFNNVSPPKCNDVSNHYAETVKVEPGDELYNFYNYMALRESEHLKPSRGIPMIMKTWFSIEKNQVILT